MATRVALLMADLKPFGASETWQTQHLRPFREELKTRAYLCIACTLDLCKRKSILSRSITMRCDNQVSEFAVFNL